MRMMLLALLILFGSAMTPCIAKDFGVVGTTYSIKEPNLLEWIQQKLLQLKDGGELAQALQKYKHDIEYKVFNPKGRHLVTTEKPRSYELDLKVTSSQALSFKEKVFTAEQQEVNPLAVLEMTKSLIFIKGSAPEQIDWAMAYAKVSDKPVKIIFVDGSPVQMMKQFSHRFYFDLNGRISKQLSIQQVPAVVYQQGQVLRVDEVVVPDI